MTDRPTRAADRSTVRTRATTVPLNYLLIVGIVALLSTGLFVGAADYVEDQQERTTRSAFRMVGDRVAAELTAADRLARSLDGTGRVSVAVDLPAQVAGTTYTVEVGSTGSPDTYLVTVRSTNPDVAVTVEFVSRTPVRTGTVPGDDLRIRYDAATGDLEVKDA